MKHEQLPSSGATARLSLTSSGAAAGLSLTTVCAQERFKVVPEGEQKRARAALASCTLAHHSAAQPHPPQRPRQDHSCLLSAVYSPAPLQDCQSGYRAQAVPRCQGHAACWFAVLCKQAESAFTGEMVHREQNKTSGGRAKAPCVLCQTALAPQAAACWCSAARPAAGCWWRVRRWARPRGAAAFWASTYRRAAARPRSCGTAWVLHNAGRAAAPA